VNLQRNKGKTKRETRKVMGGGIEAKKDDSKKALPLPIDSLYVADHSHQTILVY
jgi:hypothetical protein